MATFSQIELIKTPQDIDILFLTLFLFSMPTISLEAIIEHDIISFLQLHQQLEQISSASQKNKAGLSTQEEEVVAAWLKKIAEIKTKISTLDANTYRLEALSPYISDVEEVKKWILKTTDNYRWYLNKISKKQFHPLLIELEEAFQGLWNLIVEEKDKLQLMDPQRYGTLKDLVDEATEMFWLLQQGNFSEAVNKFGDSFLNKNTKEEFIKDRISLHMTLGAWDTLQKKRYTYNIDEQTFILQIENTLNLIWQLMQQYKAKK